MKAKGANKFSRTAKASPASVRITSARAHAASAAPEGANGETGDSNRLKRKIFLIRKNNLSSSN
jgi:hypothetical protein